MESSFVCKKKSITIGEIISKYYVIMRLFGIFIINLIINSYKKYLINIVIESNECTCLSEKITSVFDKFKCTNLLDQIVYDIDFSNSITICGIIILGVIMYNYDKFKNIFKNTFGITHDIDIGFVFVWIYTFSICLNFSNSIIHKELQIYFSSGSFDLFDSNQKITNMISFNLNLLIFIQYVQELARLLYTICVGFILLLASTSPIIIFYYEKFAQIKFEYYEYETVKHKIHQ